MRLGTKIKGKGRACLPLQAAVGFAIAAVAAAAMAQPVPAPAQAAPSPARPIGRSADGHPDLNGYWSPNPPRAGARPAGLPAGDANDLAAVGAYRNGDITNLTNDNVPRRRMSDNLPLYKPEYWEKVLDLDLNGNQEDTFDHCMPMGVPRMGGPARIMQGPSEFVFFYNVQFQHNQYRDIPLGPRRFPVDRDGSWLGDPVARWDGDTLVVETEGFNDQTWIGPEGFFHSYDMKVVERFRPEVDRLIYDVTVSDPEVLQKPWVMTTRTLYRNADPNFRMEESPPCSDRDLKNLVGKQREM
jgi:hypothetical protein